MACLRIICGTAFVGDSGGVCMAILKPIEEALKAFLHQVPIHSEQLVIVVPVSALGARVQVLEITRVPLPVEYEFAVLREVIVSEGEVPYAIAQLMESDDECVIVRLEKVRKGFFTHRWALYDPICQKSDENFAVAFNQV